MCVYIYIYILYTVISCYMASPAVQFALWLLAAS